uniref:Small ribosomal subunit protein uS9m n=1 Tax=Cyprinodon variegatus TaxID=28743 RepID=A0A3Q2FMD9_CYPVA
WCSLIQSLSKPSCNSVMMLFSHFQLLIFPELEMNKIFESVCFFFFLVSINFFNHPLSFWSLYTIIHDRFRSIAYLFPSGLFEKKARPFMKHPDEVFPKQRAVQWGPDGRPFHFLFYTGKQSYYSLMHELYAKVLNIEKHQDRLRAKGLFSAEPKQISLGTSRWLTKEELEATLVETISSHDYDRFIQLMERMLSMPYSSLEEEFILRYRQQLEAQSMHQIVPPLQKDEKGVDFSTAEGKRKTSRSSVVVRDCGSGRITINGEDYLHYFPVLQDREQLMFPLQFAGVLGRFDLEATVSGGGRSSQAGALRLAISKALLSFLSETEGEAMRQAGLLTPDPRVRERKKPGQEGARRKFTWKKR